MFDHKRYIEVSSNRDDIARIEKECEAQKYHITIHTPEGDIEADNFILTAQNKKTGQVFFSAKDLRPLKDSIAMLLAAVTDTTKLLYEVAKKFYTREETDRTIDDIVDLLRKFRKG